jgi:hypothetical protein
LILRSGDRQRWSARRCLTSYDSTLPILAYTHRNALKLFIESTQVRLIHGKAEVITIPVASITEISYGQDVHRRIGTAIGLAVISLGIGALMALSKSKKHFIGLTWANGDQKGGFAMQCDKNDYRGILAGLEGLTGKKAVDSTAMTVKN